MKELVEGKEVEWGKFDNESLIYRYIFMSSRGEERDDLMVEINRRGLATVALRVLMRLVIGSWGIIEEVMREEGRYA